MVAFLASKGVADAISEEGVYYLSQHLLGHHSSLSAEDGPAKARKTGVGLVEELIPPQTRGDQRNSRIQIESTEDKEFDGCRVNSDE